MTQTAEIIAKLGLERHPEGGWYRETWRGEVQDGARAAGTSILFLLEAGQKSHWHRVDAAELWMFHAGAPLILRTASGPVVTETRMGANIAAGETAQAIVAQHQWQSAVATDGWALVGCVVVPGFEFSGFKIAPPGWIPGFN
jgi:predicted cupin superfamily sugar epimerase